MAASSSLSFRPFFSSVATDSKDVPSATENGAYDYTRSGNPTWFFILCTVFIVSFLFISIFSLSAKLDKADRAFCFTSGMAALAAVAHLVGTGEEIVAGYDIYGGSDWLLSQVIPKTGVVVKRVNTSDLGEVASAIGPSTKLVWLESPTNPRQIISDIRKIAEMAHAHGAIVLVDNSIMSPVLSQPLDLGASKENNLLTSKLLQITNLFELLLFFVRPSFFHTLLCTRPQSLLLDTVMSWQLYFLQNAEGSGVAPFNCWICLRGIKTMALRVQKQQVWFQPRL
ncbi:hypothetical protein FF1_014487 [Malus domestica]